MLDLVEMALQIGVTTADITPPAGVTLSGYGSRQGLASGVSHPLRAEALVCRGPSAAWALVTSDAIAYPRAFVEAVRRGAAGLTGLSPEAIMVSATHTHSGPAGMRPYAEALVAADHVYRERLEQVLAGLVAEAQRAAAPGRFEVTQTEAPDLGHNRRVVEGGACRNEWEDPQGLHAGYFDPTVALLGVRRGDGTLEALLVSFGCHPVTLGPANLMISPDYVGYLKDFAEARGGVRTAVFALAGAADINPRECIRTDADIPARMGQRLGQVAVEALARLRPIAAGPIASVQESWTFEQTRNGQTRPVTTEIQALRAGDLALLGIPGELFSRYVRRFRETSPLPETMVVSMANDAVGYLPLDEAYPQGGLEVTRAATAAVEGPLKEHVARALSRLARSDGQQAQEGGGG